MARWPAAAVCLALALGLHALLLGTGADEPPPRQAPATATAWVRQLEAAPAPATPPPASPRVEAPPVAPAPAEPLVAPRRSAPARVRVAAAPASSPEPVTAVPVGEAGPPLLVAAEEADQATPTYRTRMPPAATLRFGLRRGMFSGNAVLQWAPAAAGYEARFEASVAGVALMMQNSRGGFDAAGLAPERFTDQRARRAPVAANFQRAAGKLSFSGSAAEYPLSAGMQDRLSWLIQLAAIAEADPAALTPGAEIALKVAGARGELSVWRLRVQGVETLRLAGTPVSAVRLSRQARGLHDSGAEVWLDPLRHHLPVRVVLNAPAEGDGRAPLELDLVSLAMPP